MDNKGKSVLAVAISLLLILILLPQSQYYYKAVYVIILFGICCLFDIKDLKNAYMFSFLALVIFVILNCISCLHGTVMRSNHIAMFIHYSVWPILLLLLVKDGNIKTIRNILYTVLTIFLIFEIISIKNLLINPDISRLMAGVYEHDIMLDYYKMGIGGYGHVYSAAFMCYGIIRWIKVSIKKVEKLFLIVCLLCSYIFILRASYTTAILMTLILSVLALMNEKSKKKEITFLIMGISAVILFSDSILNGIMNMADRLNLPLVSERIEQLLIAGTTGQYGKLDRIYLYKYSIHQFSTHLLGGGDFGGHSEIFDIFAVYGVFAGLFLLFFRNCFKLNNKTIADNSLKLFYLVFILLACINTVSDKRIPCAVLFCVPLIIYFINNNEIKSDNKDNIDHKDNKVLVHKGIKI